MYIFIYRFVSKFKQHIMNLDTELHSDNEQANEKQNIKVEELDDVKDNLMRPVTKLDFLGNDVSISRCSSLSSEVRVYSNCYF